MFDRRDPCFATSAARRVIKYRVVCFGCARSPYQVKSRTAQVSGGGSPGLGEGDFGTSSQTMRAGRIGGEALRRVKPCFPGGGAKRRGGVVVEVNHERSLTGGAIEASFVRL